MKPIILVTNKFTDNPNGFGIGRLVSLRVNYLNAIIQAGGVPVLSALGDAERYADIANGILFTGGADIDPIRYGEKVNGANPADAELDDLEFKLFHAFRERNKPIFGICRGIQTINVALGGTLVQDIPSQIENPLSHTGAARHIVTTTEDSVLRQLLGESFTTNTHHHQAVKSCGQGLRITATAPDGVTEAVEHESGRILAVQWHPERMIGEENFDIGNMMPLFRYFVELCRD